MIDAIHCVLALDASLGRVDYELLPQQSLLEMTVSDINDISMFCDHDGYFFECTRWVGVSCDLDENVRNIKWSNLHNSFFAEGGTVHVEWLPQTLQTFDIFMNHLYGSVDLTRLPASMRLFVVTANRLEGAADLTALPRELQYLYLARNSFSGGVRVANLPDSLIEIDIAENALSGAVDLTALSAGIRKINLSSNKLSGSLLVSTLSANLHSIDVSFNAVRWVFNTDGMPIFDQRILKL